MIALNLGPAGAHGSFPLVLLGTLAAAIPLGAAGYYLIERPLLKLKYRPMRELLSRR